MKHALSEARAVFRWSMVPKALFGALLFFGAVKYGLAFGGAVIEPAILEMKNGR